MSVVSRVIVLLLLLFVPVLSAADVRRHAIGVGWNDGRMSSDDSFRTIGFDGYTLFGKIGISDRWGILVSYRELEDSEHPDSSKMGDLTQVGVHAVILGRASKRVRPFFKFGVTRLDIDTRIVGFRIDGDTNSFSLGAGLEAGSQKVAFYADFDITGFEVEGTDEDFGLSVLTLGIVFKPWD